MPEPGSKVRPKNHDTFMEQQRHLRTRVERWERWLGDGNGRSKSNQDARHLIVYDKPFTAYIGGWLCARDILPCIFVEAVLT